MKKFTIYLMAVLLGASAAIAENDYIANKRIDHIRNGTQLKKDRIEDLYVADDLTVVDDASIRGDLTVFGSQIVSGLVRDVPTALSVTNGQAVTVAKQTYLISGIGGAATTTNTFTLAAPGTALLGLEVTFVVSSTSSQLVSIADSGTVQASSAWIGNTNDVAKFYAATATLWVQSGEEDN